MGPQSSTLSILVFIAQYFPTAAAISDTSDTIDTTVPPSNIAPIATFSVDFSCHDALIRDDYCRAHPASRPSPDIPPSPSRPSGSDMASLPGGVPVATTPPAPHRAVPRSAIPSSATPSQLDDADGAAALATLGDVAVAGSTLATTAIASSLALSLLSPQPSQLDDADGPAALAMPGDAAVAGSTSAASSVATSRAAAAASAVGAARRRRRRRRARHDWRRGCGGLDTRRHRRRRHRCATASASLRVLLYPISSRSRPLIGGGRLNSDTLAWYY